MILRITACMILVSSLLLQRIQAFSRLPNWHVVAVHSVASRRRYRDTSSHLQAGSSSSTGGATGMGMAATKAAVTSKEDKNGKKKNGMCKKISNNSSNSGNVKNGKKKQVVAFDVSASLSRLEKRYEQLELAAAKQQMARRKEDDDENDENDENEKENPRWATVVEDDNNNNNKAEENIKTIITSEFIVAARASTRLGVDDWVPVAQLLLSRCDEMSSMSMSMSRTTTSMSMSSLDLAGIAVSAYCRELSHLAALGAPAFFKSGVARNGLEYSLESIDSFHKHVYTGVVDGGHAKIMTKAEARKVLGLEETSNNNNNNANGASSSSSSSSDDNIVVNPKSAIKQAYRRLSFDLHPDRFQGTPEEHQVAAQRFAQVKLAYESLSSGVRGVQGSSWYESLGGKSRTDFCGPVDLTMWPLSTAENDLKQRGCEAAIAGLDKDLIQSFVARNLRSSE